MVTKLASSSQIRCSSSPAAPRPNERTNGRTDSASYVCAMRLGMNSGNMTNRIFQTERGGKTSRVISFFLFTFLSFFILPTSLTLGRFTARNEEHLSLSLPPDLGGGGGGHGHGDVKLTSESTGNYKTRERSRWRESSRSSPQFHRF